MITRGTPISRNLHLKPIACQSQAMQAMLQGPNMQSQGSLSWNSPQGTPHISDGFLRFSGMLFLGAKKEYKAWKTRWWLTSWWLTSTCCIVQTDQYNTLMMTCNGNPITKARKNTKLMPQTSTPFWRERSSCIERGFLLVDVGVQKYIHFYQGTQ